MIKTGEEISYLVSLGMYVGAIPLPDGTFQLMFCYYMEK